MTDRDTHYCSICRKLGSGVHHTDRFFIGDCCAGKMKPETIGEIAVIWK